MGNSRAEGSSTIGDGGQAARDNVRQTPELTYMIGHANAHSRL